MVKLERSAKIDTQGRLERSEGKSQTAALRRRVLPETQRKRPGSVSNPSARIDSSHQSLAPAKLEKVVEAALREGIRSDGVIDDDLFDEIFEKLKYIHLTHYKTTSNIEKDHIEFERIHPFEDGNGRTGRLLINYELLKNNLPPVVISKEDRVKYFEFLNHDVIFFYHVYI